MQVSESLRGRKKIHRSVPTDPFKAGVIALAEAREGKRTLRTHAFGSKPAPQVAPQDLIGLRERLKLSRALFARSAD